MKSLLLFQKSIEQGQLRGRDGRPVGMVVEQAVGVHGNKNRRVRIFRRNQPHGTVAYGKIIFQINFLERRIFSYQLHGERAGFTLPRDLRRGIARGPSIVVARDSAQHMFARFRRQKSLVAPALGKGSSQARMIRMRYEPPSCFSL